MKNTINRMMVAILLAWVTAGGFALAQELAPSWRGQPGTTRQVWRFDTSANPAAPELAVGGASGGKARTAPGQFSMGWKHVVPGLGSGSSGFWDLGRSGTITLALSNSGPAPYQRISVLVSQWLDGGIYSDAATVTVPGGSSAWVDQGLVTTATVGGWFEELSEWMVPVGTTVDQVLVTGAYNGSIIDRVEVDTLGVAPTPTLLSIRPLPGETTLVEVSWPASGGSGQLEWSADLSNAQGWQPVDAAAQLNGTRYSVLLEGSATSRFFRLKQQ